MSSGPTYDEKLLLHAPQVAKAEAREGYNVDILSPEMQGGRSGSNHDAAFPPPQPARESYHADEAQHEKPSRPSFWRSTRGKVVIALIILVILAAAIGGGVGGALGKKGKSSSTGQGITGSDGSGSSGSDTTQGISPQSSDGSGQH